MLGKVSNAAAGPSTEYHEESIRIPVAVTVAVLLIIGIPLAIWIYRIDTAGKESTNVTKYEELVNTVDDDLQTVNVVLSNDAEELEAFNAARKSGTVRLIVPEVVIIEKRNDQVEGLNPLRIEIDGIYWNPANPLVTINGEIYREGDVIQGYTIEKIGKRSVQFKGADGTLVEKDMYEDLLKTQ